MAVRPTEDELQDISLCAQKLWDLDENRLQNLTEYDINVGGGKKMFEGHDAAEGKLIAGVTKAVWQKPTFRALYTLLDNYQKETGEAEVDTAVERKELSDFLEAIMDTAPMQYCHKYLVAKRQAQPDRQAFKNQLYQMWFAYYRREGVSDSCGFEHVFVGESYDDDVSGFHNWVQFWLEESKGNVNYRGYIKPRGNRETVDDNDRILSIQFEWAGENKGITTLFIGTSPEFEMALYTLYWAAGQERNEVYIDGYEVCVRCYRIRSKYGDKVGSCFPELFGDTRDSR